LSEAIRPLPRTTKNSKPIFLQVRDWEFRVYAPGYEYYGTGTPHWSDYSNFWNVLGIAFCWLPPVAWIIWTVGYRKIEKEILRQLGWQETGPYAIHYGRYVWKNRKLYFLGA
jgi:hypothetical protein